MTENRRTKTLTSRGIAVDLNRTNGECEVRTHFGKHSLSRAESILWFAARFDVVTEFELANRYYMTFESMGIAEVDIKDPFLSLLDKGCLTFGRDDHRQDSLYRMFCQGVPTVSAQMDYKGDNVTAYNPLINFDRVYQGVAMDLTEDCREDAEYLTQMIAADKWTFPQLVHNIALHRPSSYTRMDEFKETTSPESKVIPLFADKSDDTRPLKDRYYKTDVGRKTAVLLAKLIIARRVFLM